jgi:hypothetical protein
MTGNFETETASEVLRDALILQQLSQKRQRLAGLINPRSSAAAYCRNQTSSAVADQRREK